MSEVRDTPIILKGQKWHGRLGDRVLVWRVSWIGRKKVRLQAETGYGWATATVAIDTLLDSPDWEIV